MSHLALRGTEITRKVLKETAAQMHMRHTDEQGHLDIAVENENVRVSYTVDREREEISKGVVGAITGAGLGGVRGNVLRKNEGLGDAITGVFGGAAAGGAYGAYDGYEESKDNRTNFAAVLAETIKEVEDELQYIIQGQVEAKEAIRERGRQKLEEDSAKEEEYRGMLEDLYGQVIAVQEEVDIVSAKSPMSQKPRDGLTGPKACIRKRRHHLRKKSTQQ